MFNPKEPYNDLPLLPPEIDIITPAIFKKTIEANKSLAELKGIGDIIPNQAIILNSLILREAKDSSEIENIVTTQDDLYKAFSIEKAALNHATKEVLNYREALWYGYELIKKKQLITTNEIVKIQEVLVKNNAGIRRQPGTALKNSKTGETIYTPPFGKEVIEEKLRNLENYINIDDDDTDPLIKMAIMHYQFESIHPFYDGNGRTGRMLINLMLIHNDFPTLIVENRKRKQYYQVLSIAHKADLTETDIQLYKPVVNFLYAQLCSTYERIFSKWG